jgi:hypothetical protein
MVLVAEVKVLGKETLETERLERVALVPTILVEEERVVTRVVPVALVKRSETRLARVDQRLVIVPLVMEALVMVALLKIGVSVRA